MRLCISIVNIISRFVVCCTSLRAGKAQNSIKLEHEALDYAYTVQRWSANVANTVTESFFELPTQQLR